MSDLRPNSEIAEGIHWIKDIYVNAYIVESGEDLILIDSGFNKKAKPILNYIREELESRNISKILLTHHHADHVGGLHHLHNHLHSRVFSSEQDGRYIKGEINRPPPNNFILKPLYYILRPLITPKPVTQVEYVVEGEIIEDEGDEGFEVHSLPGHTMGSLGFLKNKVLFSGDAGVSKDGDVELGVKLFAENMDVARASLVKMSKLKFDLLLSGHGTPILEDAQQRALEAVERLGLDESLFEE